MLEQALEECKNIGVRKETLKMKECVLFCVLLSVATLRQVSYVRKRNNMLVLFGIDSHKHAT